MTERDEAEGRGRLRSPVVYEIVRREGEEELARPVSSLFWSGTAAGVGMSASLLGQGLLRHYLPDVPWRPTVESFGYCLGFLIVILGRLQLFTEQTITAVLPLLRDFGLRNLWRTARLWAVVLLANVVGTFVTAVITIFADTMHSRHLPALLAVSREYAAMTPLDAMVYGIPAGFFVAAIVWMRPNSEGAQFWIVVALTYLIALGSFSHVVVGAAEIFFLQLTGEVGVTAGVVGLLLPTLVGNVVGGTGLFAVLAYEQVHEELL